MVTIVIDFLIKILEKSMFRVTVVRSYKASVYIDDTDNKSNAEKYGCDDIEKHIANGAYDQLEDYKDNYDVTIEEV